VNFQIHKHYHMQPHGHFFFLIILRVFPIYCLFLLNHFNYFFKLFYFTCFSYLLSVFIKSLSLAPRFSCLQSMCNILSTIVNQRMKPFKTFNNRIKNSTCLFINLIVSSILLCVIIEIDLKSRDLMFLFVLAL
jgi:hypothetical protein